MERTRNLVVSYNSSIDMFPTNSPTDFKTKIHCNSRQNISLKIKKVSISFNRQNVESSNVPAIIISNSGEVL